MQKEGSAQESKARNICLFLEITEKPGGVVVDLFCIDALQVHVVKTETGVEVVHIYIYIYAKRESHRLSSNKECKIFFHNFLSTSSRFFKDLIFQIETFHIYTVRCFHLTSLFQF